MLKRLLSKGPAIYGEKTKKDIWPYVFIIGALVFLVVFLLYPLLNVLALAFLPQGQRLSWGNLQNLTLANFGRFRSSALFRQALFNSLKLATGTMITSSIIGVTYAFFLARVKVKVNRLIFITLGTLPLVMPPFIGSYSWVMLFGRNGAITQFFNTFLGISIPSIYSLGGMIFAMTVTRWPYVFLMTYGALAIGDRYLEESAEIMGASGFYRFRTLTLPLVFPAIAAGAVVVFMRAIGNFGTPAILGGNKYVLPTLINFQISGYNNFNAASAIAIVSIMISLLVLLFSRWLKSRHDYITVTSQSSQLKLHDKPALNIIGTIVVILIIFVSLLPQMIMLMGSFAETWVGTALPTKWSLLNYRTVFNRNLIAMKNSFTLVIIATFVATLMGTMLAYISAKKRFKGKIVIDLVVMLPFLIPGIVLGVAVLSAFITGPLVLVGTGAILIIAYIIRWMPYNYRSGLSSLEAMDKNMEDASSICGATWLYTTKRITIPLIMPGVVAGAIITFITLLGELSATVILYSARYKTITIAIYEYLISNLYGPAFAMATLLFLIVFILIFLLNKVTGMDIGSMFKGN